MMLRKDGYLLLLFVFLSGVSFGQNNMQYGTFNRFFGDSLPLMELETIDSLAFDTRSLAGKTVYIDCWFTTCSPCLEQQPFAAGLHQFFSSDTNVVFLNICIEPVERKAAWRKMVQERKLPGIQVFYARNRPQKFNLLRRFGVDDFPTYLLAHNLKIIGYKAPRPSQKGFVHWAIYQALHNKPLAKANQLIDDKDKAATEWVRQQWTAIEATQPQ